FDRVEVIRPPLDRDESNLSNSRCPRTRSMQLDENDVAWAEQIGRSTNRWRGSESEDRDRADVRVGADACDTEAVSITTEFAEDCRAVISPTEIVRRRPPDDTSLIHRQVFVREPPLAF